MKGAVKTKYVFVQKIHPLFHKANCFLYLVMHQTSLAFLASRQLVSWIGINKTGWKEETKVLCLHWATWHQLHSCPCGFCLYHRLPLLEELVTRGHTWVTDNLLCPPLLSSSHGFKPKLLLKGKKACVSVDNWCPTPVWLLETTRENWWSQLFCLGQYFLLGHCSRKVDLKSDYCRLMACDDYSTVCPAGNTPR